MVEVSLKQARRLDAAVQTAIDTALAKSRRTEQTTFATLALGQDAAATFVSETLDLAQELIAVRFILRGAVDAKNAEVGINKLCGQIAELEEQVRVIRSLNSHISFRYRMGKDHEGYGSYYPDFSTELTRLQFQISELKDRCTGLNSQTKISLPTQVVDVLKSLGVPM